MGDDSKEKTAFSTASGLYQFRFMPFGLKTGAAMFTKLIRQVLEGVSNAHPYIDDVVVATGSWVEHVSTLQMLFERLNETKLAAKQGKYEFGFLQVTSWDIG